MKYWTERILLCLFAVCGFGFLYFRDQVGGDYLDTVFTTRTTECVLSSMDAPQRTAHIRITLSIDVLFPIVYATLLARMAIGSKQFSWLAVPAFLAMVTDFCENICHIYILNGVNGLLTLKVILTNSKFALIGIAILIAIFIFRNERKP